MNLHSFYKIALLIFLGFSVVGCATLNSTGFVTNASVDVAPIAGSYNDARPPITINDPTDKIVIIYNHGTSRPQVVENCNASWSQVPQSLLALQSEGVIIYYLCSRATEANDASPVGQYIYKRLGELEAVTDELIAVGIKANNIFLAGHSAGGWTSLMAEKYFGEKFNAVIAFAPAFAGPRFEENLYPQWRKQARPKQIQDMLGAEKINALVFAYIDDKYNRPQDLEFLSEKYPTSVQLVAYNCDYKNKHLMHLNDCREEKTTHTISNYFKQRVER